MGNKSSKSSKTRHHFCCPCLLSKSSSLPLSSPSLSIDEKHFPTFDRLTLNDKISKPSNLNEIIPSNSIAVHNEINKSLLSSNNRRSISLNNVILNVPDIDNDNHEKRTIDSKPPLPREKSKAISKLPPIDRSFRGTLINEKRTYYSQSIEHAKLSIEDLEKSLHGASSIDQWIDSLPMLGTPSLNHNKIVRTVVSTNNKKIKRSLTIGDECNGNILNGSYGQVNEILNFCS